MSKNKQPIVSANVVPLNTIMQGPDGSNWVALYNPRGGQRWQQLAGKPVKEKMSPPKEKASDYPGHRKLGQDRRWWVSTEIRDGVYQWRRPTKDAAAAGERVVRFADPLDPIPDIRATNTVQQDHREILKACTWVSKLEPGDMKSRINQEQATLIRDKFGAIVTKYSVTDHGLSPKSDLQSLRHNCNRMGHIFKYLLISKAVIKKDASDMEKACAWLTKLDTGDLKSPIVLRQIAQISAKTHEVVDRYDLNRDNKLIAGISPKAFKRNCEIINTSLKKLSEREF